MGNRARHGTGSRPAGPGGLESTLTTDNSWGSDRGQLAVLPTCL